MRLLVLLVCAFAAVLLVVPFWFGQAAEIHVGDFVEGLDSDPRVAVVDHIHARGWYTSEGKLVFNETVAGSTVEYRYTVFHGPMVWNTGLDPLQARISGDISAVGRANNTTRFGGSLVMDFNYQGMVNTSLFIPSGRLDDGDFSRTGFENLRVKCDIDYQQNNLDCSNRIGSALIELAGLTFELSEGELALQWESERQTTASLTTSELVATSGVRVLRAESSRAGLQWLRSRGTRTLRSRARLQSMKAEQALGNGSLSIDASGFAEPYVSMLIGKLDSGLAVSSTATLSLVPDLISILQQGKPKISLNARVGEGTRESTLSANVGLQETAGNTLAIDQLVRLLRGSVDLDVHAEMFDEIISWISVLDGVPRQTSDISGQLVRSGLVVEKNDRYLGQFNIIDGAMDINGRRHTLFPSN